jgi:hypothetical protein
VKRLAQLFILLVLLAVIATFAGRYGEYSVTGFLYGTMAMFVVMTLLTILRETDE